MARIPKEPETERRVYVLPKELLNRMRAYQYENNIPSEVEVVRKLLDEALQARDTLDSIMIKVRDAYESERDLRLVAQNILSGHILVKYLMIADDRLEFGLRNGEAGSLHINGDLKKGSVNDDGTLWVHHIWAPPEPKVDGLDEEIPF